MRIMDEQISRLTRALGNLFTPMLKSILPYLNAFLMVLTEIITWLGTLVGYNEKEFDFFGGTSDSVVDLKENLDGAYSSASKLKSGLRSFDKLNNITTPSASSGGVGGGSGIDPKILEMFNKASDDYLNKMMKVEMKATKIRDRIMEWLGFTKLTDEETGDVSFKFDHLTGGTVLGALGIGGVIFNGIKLIFKLLNKIGLFKFTGLFNIFKAIKGISFTKIIKSITSVGKSIKGFILSPIGLILTSVALLTGAVIKLYKENDTFKEKVNNLIGIMVDSLKPILDTLKGIFKEIFGILKTLWKNVLEPIASVLLDVLEPILETIVDILTIIFKDVIKPLSSLLSGALLSAIKVIGNILENVVAPILEVIFKVIDNIWNKALKPLVDNLVKVVGGTFERVFGTISKIVQDCSDAIQWLVDKWNHVKFKDKKVKIEGDFNVKNDNWSGGSSGNKFASGGMPRVGQMFIANESGPELVGHIGGQSFVANQTQMMDLLDKKLGNANGGVSNATFVIQVGSEEVGRVVLNDLNSMAKDNGKPIVIGG